MNRDTNTTRRCMMRASVGLVAGTAALATAGVATAQEKLAKNLVQYQETGKDGAECDKCVNWVAPDACKIVDGKIAPKGWCVAYAPKDG